MNETQPATAEVVHQPPQQSVAVRESTSVPVAVERTVDEVLEMAAKVLDLQRRAMVEGQHYGIIKGTKKPTLYKAGAEKIFFLFNLAPRVEQIQEKDLPNGHREYRLVYGLYHKITNQFWGAGVGACTTMEAKYRWRNKLRTCYSCGQNTVLQNRKTKAFFCASGKGGCGRGFKADDPNIVKQRSGRIEHDNPADYYNTCFKMAAKRAKNDAALVATAASDVFTQDLEPPGNADNKTTTPPKEEKKQQKKAAPKENGSKPMTDSQREALMDFSGQPGISEKTQKWIDTALEKGTTFQKAAGLINYAKDETTPS